MREFIVQTRSRCEFVDVTAQVAEAVRDLGLEEGVATVFVPHTTAGVTINENADPDVTADLERIFDRMVPWSAGYAHAEGNSAAHAKASLVGFSAQTLVSGGQLRMGTWQGIYFCEFDGPRARKVWISGARTK